jgi:hypothetical protein
MSLDDVASCVLYFSSVSTFWQVFYCHLNCWVCWHNLTAFLSILSGDKQWKAIHRDMAAISKTRCFLPAYKQQACCAVRRYDSTKSRFPSTL